MILPELFIARHGQTEWNLQGWMQGNLDSPLTEKGRAQARQLGAIFARLDVRPERVLTSPQLRAVHTAAIALDGLSAEISTDPLLREIGVGAWQGEPTAELKASVTDQPNTHLLHYYDHAPGGETFAGLRDRCTKFLMTLDQPAIVITHGITSRMLRLIALGMHDDALSDLPGGQGVVYRIKDGVQTQLT